MIKELCNKVIYDDFCSKVVLTDEESKILNLLLKKETIIKIADTMGMSDRNVSRIIKELKEKYRVYRKLEVAKLGVFKS